MYLQLQFCAVHHVTVISVYRHWVVDCCDLREAQDWIRKKKIPPESTSMRNMMTPIPSRNKTACFKQHHGKERYCFDQCYFRDIHNFATSVKNSLLLLQTISGNTIFLSVFVFFCALELTLENVAWLQNLLKLNLP